MKKDKDFSREKVALNNYSNIRSLEKYNRSNKVTDILGQNADFFPKQAEDSEVSIAV